MTKLEELIRDLCPNGVAKVMLGDVANYSQNRIAADQIDTSTYVGVDNILSNKQGITISSHVPNEGRLIKYSQGDILIGNIRPYLKKIWLATNEGGTNGDVLVVCIQNRKIIAPKYLYYVLSSDNFFLYDMQNSKGAKMPRGSKEAVMKYEFCLPPLPIQEEIVRILDTFTELTAELTARRVQYAYYRSLLLERTAHATYISISELGKWIGGKTPSMANHAYWENGTIPWISSKDMKSSVLSDTEDHITELALTQGGMTLLPKGIIAIVTRSGILKHTFPIAYVPFETTINQDIKALIVKEGISPKYAFYVLQTYAEDIRRKTKKQGGTVDSLEFQKIMEYQIPLPPLEIQHRIVHILDNFDAICSDLQIGLPAEIDARRRQYEYYRDALLTFDGSSHFGNVERERERERATTRID